MKSLADRLPPEIASQVHPDWRKNEAAYWEVRDQLLGSYRDHWLAFADGSILVSGTSPVEVFRVAQESGRHPFVICVGREEEPTHMRRVAFPYDSGYPGEALPLMSVEFRTSAGSPGLVLDRVIPDTGAVPWADCQVLKLDPSQGLPTLIGGVSGSAAGTITFLVWVHLDGQEHACRLQADFHGQERILGRDVLNQLEILFRGPAGEVVVNP